jgi:hypothetical protein
MNDTRYGGDGHESCAICGEVIAVGATPVTEASNPEIDKVLEHEHDDCRIVEGEYIGETKAEAQVRRHAFSRDTENPVSIRGGLGAMHKEHPSTCLAWVVRGFGSELHNDREYLTHNRQGAQEYVNTLCGNGFTAKVTEYLGSIAGESTVYEPVWANE